MINFTSAKRYEFIEKKECKKYLFTGCMILLATRVRPFARNWYLISFSMQQAVSIE